MSGVAFDVFRWPCRPQASMGLEPATGRSVLKFLSCRVCCGKGQGKSPFAKTRTVLPRAELRRRMLRLRNSLIARRRYGLAGRWARLCPDKADWFEQQVTYFVPSGEPTEWPEKLFVCRPDERPLRVN